MVFQQPWHGFVPGELVVSVLGWIESSKFKPSGMGKKGRKKNSSGFYAVISSAGSIPFISNWRYRTEYIWQHRIK